MATHHPHHRANTEWKTPTRQRVIDLHNDSHLKNSEIKQATDVPTPTIRRILKSSDPRHTSHPRSGRPTKLNARDVRRLIRAVTSSADGRRSFYMQIAKNLGIEASETTIRRVLRKSGIRRCVACPKPLVSWINRRKRLKWAREHLHWKLKDWLRVIFSDESTFETRQRARQFVTKRSFEKYCPDCLNKFKHSGRQTVMVWGGICGNQASGLIEFKKTAKKIKRGKNKDMLKESITSTDYINQVLEPWLGPWYHALKELGHRPIFMQDNASIHGSKESRLWLRQHQIEIMKWPPSSPDLNPDEWMWKDCKQKIKRYPKMITNAKDMFAAATKEWEALVDGGHHLKYVKTMQERCRAVIKNRGFSTKFCCFD